MTQHSLHETIDTGIHGAAPVKAWTRGLEIDPKAREQLGNMARLPFIHSHIAVMPDVHGGIGATVGSVIPTTKAIVPAAVGVDIGCGMAATRTTLKASELPDSLAALRSEIEKAVPAGNGRNGEWGTSPDRVSRPYIDRLHDRLERIADKHPKAVNKRRPIGQAGTLGGGNHFVEICLDEEQRVWVMLHSGSRGVGNQIGTYFISRAKEEMKRNHTVLADRDLAYLSEGSTLFDDYVEALHWAQDYARLNRDLMMAAVIRTLRDHKGIPKFGIDGEAVNCHHNYVSIEDHFGERVYVTRKGAVRAGVGDWGIIPGSMGAKSFIVRGLGNPESFHSCSHGAGRLHSRTAARNLFTLKDHRLATEGVECRKDEGVLDETPAAYKPIEKVMAAQADLVEIVHTLKQVLCVKG